MEGAGLQPQGVDALRERGVAGELLVALVPGEAEGDAASARTTGMPLSTQVTSTPSTVSRTRPVGSSAPVAEPSVSANASVIAGRGAGHAGDRDVAAVRDPARRAWRTVATATLSELTIRMRTSVAPSAGGDQAALEREGAHPGQDVAAVLRVGDRRLVHAELQEEVVDVGVGVAPRGRRRRPCW